MLYSFCTETIGQMRRASSSCRAVTFRDADVADLAAAPQLCERPDGIGERHFGVRRVQLVKIDALELEPLEAAFERLAQMLGARIGYPLGGLGRSKPPFGRDYQVLRIRMQCLGDHLLVDVRAVTVRSVEEVVTKFVRALQHFERAGAILRRPPDLRPAHAASRRSRGDSRADRRWRSWGCSTFGLLQMSVS
jgi:hypothetical protein